MPLALLVVGVAYLLQGQSAVVRWSEQNVSAKR